MIKTTDENCYFRGLGKRDGRIGDCLFILNKNALKGLQKKERHIVRYSKKTKISQQPCL